MCHVYRSEIEINQKNRSFGLLVTFLSRNVVIAQVEHARQETAGSNEIPVISWQQYSNEWIRWPDLFGFCGNRQEPATTGNRIRSLVHCIGFLSFSDGIPAKYCTFPRGFYRKCMGILLPGNIDLGGFTVSIRSEGCRRVTLNKLKIFFRAEQLKSKNEQVNSMCELN